MGQAEGSQLLAETAVTGALSHCSLPVAQAGSGSCQGNRSHALALSLGADGEGVIFVMLGKEAGDCFAWGRYLSQLQSPAKSYPTSKVQGRQQSLQPPS